VLPSALSGASGWDAATSYEYGALVGREVLDAGFNMALDGGVNLNREPRNGRNFEYKGEDPVLAGMLVGAEIRGLQAQGVIGVMKHYVANDQETHRSGVDRRQGLGRRIVRERRREQMSVDEERRGAKDRRSGMQRRVLQDRRSNAHKREPLGPIF